MDSIGARSIFGRGHGFTRTGNAKDWIARDMNAHWESTLRHIARVDRTQRSRDRKSDGVEQLQPWLQEALALSPNGGEDGS